MELANALEYIAVLEAELAEARSQQCEAERQLRETHYWSDESAFDVQGPRDIDSSTQPLGKAG